MRTTPPRNAAGPNPVRMLDSGKAVGAKIQRKATQATVGNRCLDLHFEIPSVV